MKKIIGSRCSGKTTEMVRNAINNTTNSNKIVFVVSCPEYVQGIVDGINPDRRVEIMSYNQFIDRKDTIGQYIDVYIDEIEGFLKSFSKLIEGYTMSLENFSIKDV